MSLTTAAEVIALAERSCLQLTLAESVEDSDIILYGLRTTPIDWVVIKLTSGASFMNRLDRRRGPMREVLIALNANIARAAGAKAAFDW